MKVCIFGTGSLGANVAINLARRFQNEISFIFVDYDRIEDVNLANQPWYDSNIGQNKATVLSAFVYRTAKCQSEVLIKKIESSTFFITHDGKAVKNCNMLIDCFDNLPSRRLTQEISDSLKIPILHSGFSDSIMMCKWGTKFPLTASDKATAPVCNRRELGSLVNLGAGYTQLVVTNYLTRSIKSWALLQLHEGIAQVHMSVGNG